MPIAIPSRVRTLAAVLLFAAAQAASAQNTAHGEFLYKTICAQCHNPGGNPGPGPIQLGAWSAANITFALENIPEMAPFEAILKPADLEDLAAYLGALFGIPRPPQAPASADAIEYYHAAFDHFFITTNAGEIAKLDDGTFVGWTRTGQKFKVYTAAGTGLSGVCRFFSTSFAPKSSHFYTASASECTTVKANADWQFEDVVFFVGTPAADGTCAAGIPVYRLYNNGQGAAPNHRFTTDLAVRQDMIGKGWIPEGEGVGVAMCAPI